LRWFDDYVVPNNRYHEQRMKKSVLQSSLIPFFGTMPVSEITGHDVERYQGTCAKGSAARKTINNRLAIFRKCATTAYEWLKLPGAPPKVTWPQVPSQSHRLLVG